MRLTKKITDEATYQSGNGRRDVRWDDDLKGFGLRIQPTGKKSFILSYRLNGRKRLMVIGRYGVLTLEESRRQARIHLGKILAGEDPLHKRRAKASNNMSDLCKAFMEKHSIPHKKTSAEDQCRIDNHILPVWRNRAIASITRYEVQGLHQKIGAKSIYDANRTLALLSTIFEKALLWGMCEENFVNPARRIEKFKEKKRDRWITPEELPRLAKAINTEVSVYVRAAIWLYLLTGMRKSELLKAKWVDVNFNRNEMKLSNTKAGNDHYVPLSRPAIDLLRALPRADDNPHIIVGARAGRPLVNISKPWLRIRKIAHCEDVRLHDLRRTVGSWLAQDGKSLHLIGKVLNHANTSTTEIYARFAQDNVRSALEGHAQRLLQAAGSSPNTQLEIEPSDS